MNLQVCLLIVCLSRIVHASDINTDELLPSMDSNLVAIDNKTIEYLKEQEFIRKTEVLACAASLATASLRRAEFKVARKVLETHWPELKKSELIREELDKIRQNHRRKFPFFIGYVSKKALNKEQRALKRLLDQSLVEQNVSVQNLQEYNPTAPVLGIAIEAENFSSHEK